MRAPIRAVIVEDEPLARQTIKDFLKGEDWLELVGEAGDGDRAVQLIDNLRPDLVFLDVRMPGLSGLQVLETIKHDPDVVFTTAYDSHAVTAFELEALDYILKPFGRERFRKMLLRVKERLLNDDDKPESSFRDRALHALKTRPAEPLLRLFVRDRRGRVVQVPLSDITRLVGADDYVEVHAGKACYLVNITLAEFERRLDPNHFHRVHRSVIVNLDKIVGCKRVDRRLHIELSDGSHVTASRAGSQDLRKLFV
ncbi:MAG TPA: LytTR family DNA-binding domain-containing protein [Pyrinomonadaceae bacterium]|nr:LytTR family DNA-binding domain-containing protein [Pyrinomonadaceae bacterium]